VFLKIRRCWRDSAAEWYRWTGKKMWVGNGKYIDWVEWKMCNLMEMNVEWKYLSGNDWKWLDWLEICWNCVKLC